MGNEWMTQYTSGRAPAYSAALRARLGINRPPSGEDFDKATVCLS